MGGIRAAANCQLSAASSGDERICEAEVSAMNMANPFDDAKLAASYEDWYAGFGLYADQQEKALLSHLLQTWSQRRTILEVGCGTGRFTRWFEQQGLSVVGLDSSGAMLAEARSLGVGNLVRGYAEALPFDNSTFDIVALITALEFVESPEQALAEAVRVARRGLLLGVLNRHSWLAVWRRASSSTLWRAGRFFSVDDLKQLVARVCDARLQSISWQTTIWPLPIWGQLSLPWGAFIGLAVGLAEVGEELDAVEFAH